MIPPAPLLAADPTLQHFAPTHAHQIAAARPLDPRKPANIWAAATVTPWNVHHDTAWLLTAFTAWPAPAQAIIARATPTPRIPVIADLDESRERLDRDTLARMQQVVDDELAALLSRLGVTVMAAVKDPKLKATLEALPLQDVWAAAQTTHAPNRDPDKPSPILAALGADGDNELERSLTRIEQRARRILENADAAAASLLNAVIAGGALPEATRRIGNALAVLRMGFAATVRRALDPRQDRDTFRDEIGGNGTVPPGIARAVLDALGGADILDTGETAIDDTGRILRNGVPSPPGHAVSNIVDDGLADRLREIGRNLRTGADAERLVGEHGRDITALARAVTQQRLEMRKQLIWRRGNPPNPFDPHVPLEGVIHNSEDHLRLSSEPLVRTLQDGSTRSVAPWGSRGGVSLGRWHPQDHNGCRCEWVTRTVPTLVPDLAQGPQRTAEEALIDEILGATL